MGGVDNSGGASRSFMELQKLHWLLKTPEILIWLKLHEAQGSLLKLVKLKSFKLRHNLAYRRRNIVNRH